MATNPFDFSNFNDNPFDFSVEEAATIYPGAPKPSTLQGEAVLTNLKNGMNNGIDQINKNSEARNLAETEALKKKILNFNQTSYSGVDIKVVVHKYGTPTTDLKGDIQSAISVYINIQDLILDLANNIVPAIGQIGQALKRGEVVPANYQDMLNRYKTIVGQINQKEGEVKSTGFYQFIGTTLFSRLIDAQQNPSAFSDELRRLSSFVGTLISEWKAQSSSLESRSLDLVSTKTLAELQTISISSYREKTAVRALGYSAVKGYTRGPVTTAGSMIFTVFDRDVLFDLLETTRFDADNNFRAGRKDQLPPLDLTIVFANEYGALSRMSLYGVEFVSEGKSMSIEDIILEDVCQFVCRDFDPMTPVLNAQGEPYNSVMLNYNQAIAAGKIPASRNDLRASDLRGSEWDLNKNQNGMAAVNRFKARYNPFK